MPIGFAIRHGLMRPEHARALHELFQGGGSIKFSRDTGFKHSVESKRSGLKRISKSVFLERHSPFSELAELGFIEVEHRTGGGESFEYKIPKGAGLELLRALKEFREPAKPFLASAVDLKVISPAHVEALRQILPQGWVMFPERGAGKGIIKRGNKTEKLGERTWRKQLQMYRELVRLELIKGDQQFNPTIFSVHEGKVQELVRLLAEYHDFRKLERK